MSGEKLIFDEAVEGFFKRALGGTLSPRGRAKLREAGLDLDQKLKPAYRLEDFRTFVEIARTDVYPGLPRQEAHRLMGQQMITGYGQTLLGKTLLSMLRLLGVERSLKRLDQNMRAVNNFTETKITFLQPDGVEYWVNEISISPDFSLGLIDAGMTASGATTVDAQHLPDRAPGYTFRIRWTEKR